MNRLFRYVLLAPWLAGCATADLSGFADQTDALMTAVNEEQQAVAVKMNEVITLTKLADQEGWFKEPVFPSDDGSAEKDVADLAKSFKTSDYVQLRQQFVDLAEAIQQTLNAITKYSMSLAELAAAGETGRAAVKKSAGTLNSIASALGGPTTLIGGAAIGIVEEIGDLVTRAQAQERIVDAMAILAGSDGALRKTIGLLQQLLDTLEENFIGPVHDQIIVLEQYKYGPGLLSFYEGSSSWMYSNRAFYLLRMDDEAQKEFIADTTEREMYDALKACLDDNPGCPRASLASGLAARLLLIGDIEDEYRAFEAAKTQTSEWRNMRIERIAQLRIALDTWADQHDAIYESIQSCGGFKALKPGCGNWSEASLRISIEKIQQIFPDISATEGEVQ